MSDPKPQLDVVNYFDSQPGTEAATVGEYVRVLPADTNKTCFGPKEGKEPLGWEVVEIDWQQRSFLFAPCDDEDGGQR